MDLSAVIEDCVRQLVARNAEAAAEARAAQAKEARKNYIKWKRKERERKEIQRKLDWEAKHKQHIINYKNYLAELRTASKRFGPINYSNYLTYEKPGEEVLPDWLTYKPKKKKPKGLFLHAECYRDYMILKEEMEKDKAKERKKAKLLAIKEASEKSKATAENKGGIKAPLLVNKTADEQANKSNGETKMAEIEDFPFLVPKVPDKLKAKSQTSSEEQVNKTAKKDNKSKKPQAENSNESIAQNTTSSEKAAGQLKAIAENKGGTYYYFDPSGLTKYIEQLEETAKKGNSKQPQLKDSKESIAQNTTSSEKAPGQLKATAENKETFNFFDLSGLTKDIEQLEEILKKGNSKQPQLKDSNESIEFKEIYKIIKELENEIGKDGSVTEKLLKNSEIAKEGNSKQPQLKDSNESIAQNTTSSEKAAGQLKATSENKETFNFFDLSELTKNIEQLAEIAKKGNSKQPQLKFSNGSMTLKLISYREGVEFKEIYKIIKELENKTGKDGSVTEKLLKNSEIAKEGNSKQPQLKDSNELIAQNTTSSEKAPGQLKATAENKGGTFKYCDLSGSTENIEQLEETAKKGNSKQPQLNYSNESIAQKLISYRKAKELENKTGKDGSVTEKLLKNSEIAKEGNSKQPLLKDSNETIVKNIISSKKAPGQLKATAENKGGTFKYFDLSGSTKNIEQLEETAKKGNSKQPQLKDSHEPNAKKLISDRKVKELENKTDKDGSVTEKLLKNSEIGEISNEPAKMDSGGSRPAEIKRLKEQVKKTAKKDNESKKPQAENSNESKAIQLISSKKAAGQLKATAENKGGTFKFFDLSGSIINREKLQKTAKEAPGQLKATAENKGGTFKFFDLSGSIINREQLKETAKEGNFKQPQAKNFVESNAKNMISSIKAPGQLKATAENKGGTCKFFDLSGSIINREKLQKTAKEESSKQPQLKFSNESLAQKLISDRKAKELENKTGKDGSVTEKFLKNSEIGKISNEPAKMDSGGSRPAEIKRLKGQVKKTAKKDNESKKPQAENSNESKAIQLISSIKAPGQLKATAENKGGTFKYFDLSGSTKNIELLKETAKKRNVKEPQSKNSDEPNAKKLKSSKKAPEQRKETAVNKDGRYFNMPR